MIYLALPLGTSHGWGVCGKYITKELARLTSVRLLTDAFEMRHVGDELDYTSLAPHVIRLDKGTAESLSNQCAASPMLQCITSAELNPTAPGLRGSRTLGYTFFEQTLLPPGSLENARRSFDQVVAGSRWCEEVLQAHGLTETATVIQGVDPTIFRPAPQFEREYFRDRFVVFSGGKAELRKGQDIVIRAYKVLQDRHHDVMLVNAWFNPWPSVLQSLRVSPLIRFRTTAQDYQQLIAGLLTENGIDLERVVTLGPRANVTMPRVYHNSDIGLFPNRCEGGTNLVLMEYMACGRPVIASYNTGHKDVVSADNALLIRRMGTLQMHNGRQPIGEWPDPDLEETVELLEWAYGHRAELPRYGAAAAADMSRFTWRATAENFLTLLSSEEPADADVCSSGVAPVPAVE